MREESSSTYDVFLSYSSKDKNRADAACAVLERHRVRCWMAPRDITPGEAWGDSIIKGINGSRMMVLIFSGHANASPQVRREVERAGSRGMNILAFRVEDVRPKGAMELVLGDRHWLDAFGPQVEQQLEKLAKSVKTLLANDVEPVDGPGVTDGGSVDTGVEPGVGRTGSGRPLAFWLVAVAASFIGLIALGVTMVAIKRSNGESKTSDSGNSSNEVSGGKTAGRDPATSAPASSAGKASDSSGTNPPISLARRGRIPPEGPARVAANVAGGAWTVEGDELINKDTVGMVVVRFGDDGWSDYDLTFEACKTAGTGCFGASFRASEGKQYWLRIGDTNKHTLGRLGHAASDKGNRSEMKSAPGTIRLRDWYKVKIALRGQRSRIELDGHLLFAYTDDFSRKGAVILRFIDAAGRFRNIKVSGPDGTVLWEGAPDLSKL
jgi:TIR domain